MLAIKKHLLPSVISIINYYYVEFSTGIFPGEKYPVKSHPETSDFQHFSEDMC